MPSDSSPTATPGDSGSPAIHAEVARLRRLVALLGAGWLVSFGWLALRPSSFPDVLAVERLEIVEPDGQPAFVFANSERPAVATMDGVPIIADQEEERRGTPSIIFYDGKGDEVGGMLMGVRETDDGYSAVRHLSLDGYKQDQTIVLSHYQSPGGYSSALRISDRPGDVSILEAMRRLGLEAGATRDEMGAAIESLPEDGREELLRELFGAPRMFVGTTRNRDAALILNDAAGRPRVRIEVPADGDPFLRFLDENGNSILELPQQETR